MIEFCLEENCKPGIEYPFNGMTYLHGKIDSIAGYDIAVTDTDLTELSDGSYPCCYVDSTQKVMCTLYLWKVTSYHQIKYKALVVMNEGDDEMHMDAIAKMTRSAEHI